jgi:hypothetical protein
MKRNIALTVLLTTTISTVLFAQKMASDNVPVVVKQAFEKAYPSAKSIKWDKF